MERILRECDQGEDIARTLLQNELAMKTKTSGKILVDKRAGYARQPILKAACRIGGRMATIDFY